MEKMTLGNVNVFVIRQEALILIIEEAIKS